MRVANPCEQTKQTLGGLRSALCKATLHRFRTKQVAGSIPECSFNGRGSFGSARATAAYTGRGFECLRLAVDRRRSK